MQGRDELIDLSKVFKYVQKIIPTNCIEGLVNKVGWVLSTDLYKTVMDLENNFIKYKLIYV